MKARSQVGKAGGHIRSGWQGGAHEFRKFGRDAVRHVTGKSRKVKQGSQAQSGKSDDLQTVICS
jgi:hypothetical protein